MTYSPAVLDKKVLSFSIISVSELWLKVYSNTPPPAEAVHGVVQGHYHRKSSRVARTACSCGVANENGAAESHFVPAEA